MAYETLSNEELIARLKRLVAEERRSLADLISHLCELEALAASLDPKRDLGDSIQRIPVRPAAIPSMAAPQSQEAEVVMPAPRPPETIPQKIDYLTPVRVHFGFTGSEERLERDARSARAWNTITSSLGLWGAGPTIPPTCRPHNQHSARQIFGDDALRR